jgi:hypothetical protein
LGETLNFYEGQTCFIRATVEIIRQFESPSPPVAALTLLAGTPAPIFTGMIGGAGRDATPLRTVAGRADSPPPRGCGTA